MGVTIRVAGRTLIGPVVEAINAWIFKSIAWWFKKGFKILAKIIKGAIDRFTPGGFTLKVCSADCAPGDSVENMSLGEIVVNAATQLAKKIIDRYHFYD